MTSPFDSMKQVKITVYGVASENYGVKTYSLKGTTDCSYSKGGSTQVDDSGVEFVPQSAFYPESTMGFEVVTGDLVAFGDTRAETDPDNVNTETVRKPMAASNPFGWPVTKWFYTG